MKKIKMNHYKFLEIYLPKFLEDAKVRGGWEWNGGIIVAHGDKFEGYRQQMEENGLHFFHGVMIGLLTYCYPYSKECREVTPSHWEGEVWIKGKWVSPIDWIIANKDRFKEILPEITVEED